MINPELWKVRMRQIGVAITVQNRFEEADLAIRRWRSVLPAGAVLFVVDDASDTPYPRADFRFEAQAGIPRAKNKCLELLEDANVEHAFLSDSDFYPTAKDWWRPYILSPEPHLSYQFEDFQGPVKLHDMIELYRDEKHVAYSAQRGCMLYYHLPTVLPQVGGFDPIYGRGMYEHTDLANRIHAAGLTTWRYADVVGSERLFHSMDEWREVSKRSIPDQEIKDLSERNCKIHNERHSIRYAAYVPYREEPPGTSNVLITTLLTANPDPQRGIKWDPSAKALAPWLETVERGEYPGVVLADELHQKDLKGYSSVKAERVPSSKMNVYYQRWMHIYQYLREHSEIQWVWCTDGSDVEVLRDPFEGMITGKLYVGEENKFLDNSWMRTHHPARSLQQFIHENRTKQLLNAGVVGGDRATVMEFAQLMVTEYNDIQCSRFWKSDPSRGTEIGDMASFNKVAYEQFGGNLVHGPEVTTEFGKFKDNGKARFKHK